MIFIILNEATKIVLVSKSQRCNPFEGNCKIRFLGCISGQVFTVSWWYWLTGTLFPGCMSGQVLTVSWWYWLTGTLLTFTFRREL